MITKYGYYCYGLAPADTQALGSVAIKNEFPRTHFSVFLKEEEPECLGPSPWTSNGSGHVAMLSLSSYKCYLENVKPPRK